MAELYPPKDRELATVAPAVSAAFDLLRNLPRDESSRPNWETAFLFLERLGILDPHHQDLIVEMLMIANGEMISQTAAVRAQKKPTKSRSGHG